MLQVQEFLDRATTAGECPVDFFLPRSGSLRRVRAMDAGELRLVRTELELLRRIQRRLRRPVPVVEPDRLGASALYHSTEQRADYAEICRCSAHPLIDEIVRLFDREFPHVREEILMSVVNEEAEAIAQSAIESGVAPSDPPAGAAPAQAVSEEGGPVAKASAVETATQPASSESATEPQASPLPPSEPQQTHPPREAEQDAATGAEETLADLDELADSLAEAEAALGEVLDLLPPDPADGKVEFEDATPERQAEEHADIPSEEPQNSVESPSETACETPDDLHETVDATPGEASRANSGDDQVTELECAEHASAELSKEQSSSESSSANSDADAQPESTVNEEPCATPRDAIATEPTAAEPSPIPPEACATPTDEVPADQEPMDAPSKEQSSGRVYDAEWAAGAVQEIDAGIRKLAELLSGDVRAQWKQASESLAEITRTRAGAEESTSEARSLLVELRTLRDEAKAATAELHAMRAEARAYREAARMAKTRAETAADIAEKLADQVRDEQSICPA